MTLASSVDASQILLDGCHDSSLHRCQTRRVITDDKKLLLLCYCFSLCRSSLLGCLRLCIIQILFLIYVGILGISRRTFLLHAGTMAAFSFRGNTSPRRDFSFFLTVTWIFFACHIYICKHFKHQMKRVWLRVFLWLISIVVSLGGFWVSWGFDSLWVIFSLSGVTEWHVSCHGLPRCSYFVSVR